MIELKDTEKLIIRVCKLQEQDKFQMYNSWSKTLLPMMPLIYGWEADSEDASDYHQGIFMFLLKTLKKIAEPESLERIEADLLTSIMFPTLLNNEKNSAKRGINYLCGEIQMTLVVQRNGEKRFDLRNYITHNDNKIIPTCGTHLQGEIVVTYTKLIETFGEAKGGSDDYKTDAEWNIQFDNGDVATIYNWKNGKAYLGCEGLDLECIDMWHVGGLTKDVVTEIQKILN